MPDNIALDRDDRDPSLDPTVELVVECMRTSQDTVTKWRKVGRLCNQFYSSHQWTQDDLDECKEGKRPAITFNRAKPVVDVISGTEINNRQDIRFVPRRVELANRNQLTELATQVRRWALDCCDGDEERSIAFLDMLNTGMGWEEMLLEYDQDLDGRYVQKRFNSMEAWWDPGSRQQNLLDARWVGRKRLFRRYDIYKLWPDARDRMVYMEPLGPNDLDDPMYIEDVSPTRYTGNQVAIDRGDMDLRNNGWLPVVQFQWWDLVNVYRILDPQTREIKTLTQTEFDTFKRRTELLPPALRRKIPMGAVRQQARKYYQAFVCGNTLLEKTDLAIQSGFTLRCMTGFWDDEDKIWYGLMRLMLDPQRAANKWLSQGLHIVNVQAKGGIIAESDAFANPTKAEAEYSKPGSITLVQPGALAKGKIEQKTLPVFPEAIVNMIQYAITSLRDVTGVNVDFIGLSEGDVAAVTMRQRQKQTLTVLALLFSSYTRFLKDEARLIIEFAREYLADGRLIRIGGEYNAQSIPLLREPLELSYDIIADENPKNPNVKEEMWQIIGQALPVLLRFNALSPALLDFAPFPASLVFQLKQDIEAAKKAAAQQPPTTDPKADPKRMEAEIAKIYAEIEKIKSDTLYNTEKAQMLDKETNYAQAEAMLKAGLEKQKQENQLMMDKARSANELQMDQARSAMDLHKQQAEYQMEGQARQQEAQTGAQESAMDLLKSLGLAAIPPQQAAQPPGEPQ